GRDRPGLDRRRRYELPLPVLGRRRGVLRAARADRGRLGLDGQPRREVEAMKRVLVLAVLVALGVASPAAAQSKIHSAPALERSKALATAPAGSPFQP